MAGLLGDNYTIGPAGPLAGLYDPPPDLRSSIGGEMRAQDILSKAGSVMARPEKPEWRKQSPLADTVLTMIDKALSLDPWHQILNIDPKTQVDPIAAMGNVGGAENAIWGPIRTAGQKQAYNALWRMDPEQAMAVHADPRTLNLRAESGTGVADRARVYEESGLMPPGATAVYNPGQSLIKVAPATMIGGHYETPIKQPENVSALKDFIEGLGVDWPGRADMLKRMEGGVFTKPGGTTDLPESMLHETQHFLNEPRVYQGRLTPQRLKDTQEMFGLLAPYVDTQYIEAAAQGAQKYNEPRIAIDELLAYLSGKSTRFPPNEAVGSQLHNILKTRTSPTGNVALPLNPQMLKNAISLAQGMGTPELAPKAMEIWDQLTAQGKVGSRTETFQPGQKAFKDLDFTSMARRTEPASMYDKLPRAGRTFMSAEDIARGQAGEQLPALGSAMPDIPRPVSSPGALDAFEALRQKLGLPPADLGGMAPEFYGKGTKAPGELAHTFDRFSAEGRRGGDVLEENLKRYNEQRAEPWAGTPEELKGIAELGPLSKDQFMHDVLSTLGNAMSETKYFAGDPLRRGIGAFRSQILGNPETAAVSGNPLVKQALTSRQQRMSIPDTVALIQHLDKNGLLDPTILGKHVGEPSSVQGTFPLTQKPRFSADEATEIGRRPNELSAKFMNRLQRFAEETAPGSTMQPTGGKGKAPGELETKAGTKALSEIRDDWMTHNATVTGSYDVPKDRFMDTVLGALARATHKGPAYEGMPQGVSGFRRTMTTAENMYNMGAKPHDAQKSLDILEHLREYGLLEPGVLEKTLESRMMGARMPGRNRQGLIVEPEGLERIKKLLERVGR